MKIASLSIASFALLQLASAQPHKGPRHVHAAHHHKKEIENRETEEVEVEVLVYVDSAGNPVSTSVETITVYSTSSSTSLSASPSSASSSSKSSSAPKSSSVPAAPPAPVPASSGQDQGQGQAAPVVASTPPATNPPPAVNPAPVVSSAPVASSTPVASTPPTVTTPPSTDSFSYGLSYSPYKADGTCKTQDDVDQDFAVFGPTYAGGIVRTYGTDCSQTITVLNAAKKYNMALFAGIYDLDDIASEVALMASAANGDWSGFNTVSVGNELVNSGTADAPTVVSAIGTAKSLLQAVGYNGPVVTVDTLVAMRANPSLCAASSYCAANCHPFFDGSTLPEDSGTFLTTQIQTLAEVVNDPSKKIVITETGWPTSGTENGIAVPSQANQGVALTAIKQAFVGNEAGVVLFTPFNDLWKVNTPSSFDAEQFWGFLGDAPSG